jgi:hypothetical protein
MNNTITCTFQITSSNDIEVPGFHGSNELLLTTPLSVSNPFGLDHTTLEITKKDFYQLKIISKELKYKELQIEFIEKAAEYLSFLINQNEKNPQYGNSYIKINWLDFLATATPKPSSDIHERLGISDTWSITSIRTLKVNEGNWQNALHGDILRFYFDGLRAEHKKSKYFHWFLVLEYLEKSKKYTQMFSLEKLFTDAESKIIEDAASKMGDNIKKSAIKNLLSRTREFRSTKLLKFINEIGITSYTSNGGLVTPTEETIASITQGRNAIFHSGSSFPDDALWNDLFPLATAVVEQIVLKNISIDATQSTSKI